VCDSKKPDKHVIIIGIAQYLFKTKFSKIIFDTVCHYCCKFCHLAFFCSEEHSFEYKDDFYLRRKIILPPLDTLKCTKTSGICHLKQKYHNISY